MSINLDICYIKELNLDRLVKKGTLLWNFRCPICGDSSKSESKKRGYLMEHKNKKQLFFHCHNCSASGDMYWLISQIASHLLNKYKVDRQAEILRGKKLKIEFNFKSNKEVIKSDNIKIVEGIIPVLELEKDHQALIYLRSRQIPEKFLTRIYFTENYHKWICKQRRKGALSWIKTDPRLVFPIKNQKSKLIGFQGRVIEGDNFRYLTDILVTGEHKIYGLDGVQTSSTIYVLEGIFDSLFVRNSIAMLGMDIQLDMLKELYPNSKIVYVLDNQKRNEFVVQKMSKVIKDRSTGVVIWDKEVSGLKDVNDIILSGRSEEWVNQYIINRTFFGLMKKQLEFVNWKRS